MHLNSVWQRLLVYNLQTLQNRNNICLFIQLTCSKLQERDQNSTVGCCCSFLNCNFKLLLRPVHGNILASGTLAIWDLVQGW